MLNIKSWSCPMARDLRLAPHLSSAWILDVQACANRVLCNVRLCHAVRRCARASKGLGVNNDDGSKCVSPFSPNCSRRTGLKREKAGGWVLITVEAGRRSKGGTDLIEGGFGDAAEEDMALALDVCTGALWLVAVEERHLYGFQRLFAGQGEIKQRKGRIKNRNKNKRPVLPASEVASNP